MVAEEGIGLRVAHAGTLDLIVSSAAGKAPSWEGVETDAPLADVRCGEGLPLRWVVGTGRRLAVDGEEIFNEPKGAAFGAG